MNAAEVTDKLGLHSLRQRAWVSEPGYLFDMALWLTTRPLVHPIHLRYLRRWPVRRSRMARIGPQEGRSLLKV